MPNKKMAENTDQELQPMLPDGQQINEASNVAVSSQQASESTVVTMDGGNSCCLR